MVVGTHLSRPMSEAASRKGKAHDTDIAGRRTKSVEQSIEDTDEPGTRLRKDLTWWDLIVFGVSVVIGAGIFTITASTAGNITGPAISISFVLAAIACGLAALCYAEFASTVPVAGSAYTFSYASFGEFVAWIIGWDLVLEFAVGAATVAKSWSTYLGEVFGFAGGEIALGPLSIDWGAVVIVAIVTTLLALGHEVVVERQRRHHADQGRRGARGHLRRRVLHQGRQLLAVHSARGVRRRLGSSSRCSRCSPAPAAATTAGTACWPARRSCSSRSSASTSSRPPPRRPRIRRATFPAASSERWPSSPCSTSRWRSCCPEWSSTPSSQRPARTPISRRRSTINGVDWAATVISIGALAGLTTVVMVLDPRPDPGAVRHVARPAAAATSWPRRASTAPRCGSPCIVGVRRRGRGRAVPDHQARRDGQRRHPVRVRAGVGGRDHPAPDPPGPAPRLPRAVGARGCRSPRSSPACG